MTRARLTGIFVGRVAPLGAIKVASAFVKNRIRRPVLAGVTGLEGDEQADRKVHGGPDMAIYVYSANHYALWRKEFPQHEALWGLGSLGENLSINGWGEKDVCIGDTVRIGSTLLQVTRPRKPCFKLALRFNDLRLPRHLVETGRCGWYYRVLQVGVISPEDELRLIERPHPEWTIRRLNDLSIRANVDIHELEELAKLPELAENWRSQVRAMAASTEASRRSGSFRTYRVAAIRDESRTIKTFQFVPADGGCVAAAVPGQHVVVRLHPDGEGRRRLRSYSISDVAVQHVQISVKREPRGGVSQLLHDELSVGDTVEILGPLGNFTLVSTSDTPVVLISAGVGITPMIPMLQAATTNNGAKIVPRLVLFLHSARNSEELAFGDQTCHVASRHPTVRRHVCFSQPLASDATGISHDSVGRIDKDLLEALLAPLGKCNVYVCGPADFIADITRWIGELGIEAELHSESFGSPGKLQEFGPPEGAAEAAVTFSKTRRSAVWRRGGASLLDLAEAQGLQIESECRSGVCGSCATRVLSGRVSYDVEPVASIAPGKMLLCCGHPLDDRLVLDI